VQISPACKRLPGATAGVFAYLRESGLRSVLVHMSRPLTAKRAQRDCEADGVPGERLQGSGLELSPLVFICLQKAIS